MSASSRPATGIRSLADGDLPDGLRDPDALVPVDECIPLDDEEPMSLADVSLVELEPLPLESLPEPEPLELMPLPELVSLP